jgi:hypothetical protein
MLMNQIITSNNEVPAWTINPERRESPRRPAIRTRARLAWRSQGLRVAKAPARLIDISEGGLSLTTSSPTPPDLSYFWVGLESLPCEWVKATLRKVERDEGCWVYHCAFLEKCAPGIIEQASTY